MNLIRRTNSLCPECYREVPAVIGIEGEQVLMSKVCPAHGQFNSVVEKDADFYTSINLGPSKIYPGYFVDVTRRCNTRCAFCYYPLEHKDPEGLFSIENIFSECVTNLRHAPFVLTGGEPTLRPDIATLIDRVGEVGGVEMLTNGIKLADPDYFDDLVPHLTRDGGIAAVHLSIHPQTNEWIKVVGLVKERGLVLGSVLIVIDSKEEFLKALELIKRIGPLSLCFRIKAASRIWNEQKPDGTEIGTSKVFVSEMISWIKELGLPVEIIKDAGNKSCFVNVLWNGLWLMLVSWFDTGNVDLHDIDCPPYYRARNGQVANFVTAGLINEGLERGWCGGVRLDSLVTPKVEVTA